MTQIAHIGMGSNLGSSEEIIHIAKLLLNQIPWTTVLAESTLFKTTPVGGPPGQNDYLNCCVTLQTDLEPNDLLGHMASIESTLGRTRAELNGPRTIDLDLLMYNDVVISNTIQIPHPRMHERSFVLRPLAQIAPHAVHPVLNKTITELLFNLEGIYETESAQKSGIFGKKVIITGSTSGIGLATALNLAKHGAKVVLHGRKPANSISGILDYCKAASGFSQYIQADISINNQRENLIAQSFSDGDFPDGIFLNAGADILTGEGSKLVPSDKLKSLWLTDAESTFELARAFGKKMKQRGHGSILTMGWDQATHGMAGDSGEIFSMIKGGIMDFTRSLALSLAPEVRVNCIAPGWIQTAWGNQASDYWKSRAVSECPLKRWGKPEDIANAARWLLSSEASFITGQTIRVNGGVVRN